MNSIAVTTLQFVIILSCCFELVECSLSWLIPEFYECWWDSLLCDAFGANLLGMVLGSIFVKVSNLKTFNFIGDQREMSKSPGGMEIVATLRSSGLDAAVNLVEKFVRLRGNFFFRSPFRLVSGSLLVVWAMIGELTTFLIMHAFDLPATEFIPLGRLILIMFCSICAIVEHHEFVEGYERKREAARNDEELPTLRVGRNMSLVLFITIAELYLVITMGRAKCNGADNTRPSWSCEEGQVAIPANVWMPWAVFAATFTLYALRRFRLGDSFNHQSWRERFFLVAALSPLFFLLRHLEFDNKDAKVRSWS